MVVDISLGLWSWYNFIQSILMIFQLVSLLMIFQQTYNKTYPSLVLSITTWIRGNDAEPPLMWYLFTHPHTTLSNRTSSSRLSHIKSHWAVGCSDTYVMWKAEWKLKTSFSPEKNANFPRTYLAASLSSTHGPEGMTDRIYDCYFK